MKLLGKKFILFIFYWLILNPLTGFSQMLVVKPDNDCGFKRQSDALINFNPMFIEERAIREITAIIPSEPGFNEKWFFDTEGRLTLFFIVSEGDTILKHSFFYTEEGSLFREFYMSTRSNEEYLITYRYNTNGSIFQQKKFTLSKNKEIRLYETSYYFYDGMAGSPNQLRIKKIINGKTTETCDCFYEKVVQKPSKYIVWENESENTPEKTVSYIYNNQSLLKEKRENFSGMTVNTEYFYDNNNLWTGVKAGGSALLFSYAPNKVLKEIQEKPGFDGKERKYVFSYLFYE